ncbi:DNA-directed RNA polymerase subunit H [Candidatus Pacearchaeota archaeon CG06_land_8_20_14_3_00_35_12]|nr:MAG: DNA-directed RNA polymerase subunit H [Candidatus Pacearchaeota archaeon CG06_land_8_20_14_3_00_35_12]
MHILQPKHSKLKQQEVQELLKRLNITAAQLPKIKKTDPALPLDTKPGEVIAIERKNPKGKKALYYRIIVA